MTDTPEPADNSPTFITFESPVEYVHANSRRAPVLEPREIVTLAVDIDAPWGKVAAGTRCVVWQVVPMILRTLVYTQPLDGQCAALPLAAEALLALPEREFASEEQMRAIAGATAASNLDVAGRQALLNSMMLAMPEDWRWRWCASGACACLGGANCSGNLSLAGFTREEWAQWMQENDPEHASPD